MTYDDDFEKIMRYKNEILMNKVKNSSFKFDKNKYYVHFLNVDIELDKQLYETTDNVIQELSRKKHKCEQKIQANQKMYLTSRSNFKDDLMKTLLDEYEAINLELKKINTSEKFILLKESKQMPSPNTLVPAQPKKESPTTSPKVKSKKHAIKKFLFKTYEDCISQKKSSPSFMSKQQIIDHLLAYEPDIIKKLPKSFQNKKSTAKRTYKLFWSCDTSKPHFWWNDLEFPRQWKRSF